MQRGMRDEERQRERERGGLVDATAAPGGHNAGHVERTRRVADWQLYAPKKKETAGRQKVKREARKHTTCKGKRRKGEGNTTKLDKQFTNQKSTRRAKADACLRCS